MEIVVKLEMYTTKNEILAKDWNYFKLWPEEHRNPRLGNTHQPFVSVEEVIPGFSELYWNPDRR